VLELRDVVCRYGQVTALKGVSLTVGKGQLVALIGANGAGKTTTLRTISGLLKPRSGEVTYDGRTITGTKPHVITAMGVSHVPEGRGIFANLTVNDNLELGAYLRKDKVTNAEYGIQDTEQYLQSPVRVVYERHAEVRRRLADPACPMDFPILADPTKETARKYGVLADFSRFNLGEVANRWTFYIGKDGKIQAIDKDVQTRLATSAEDMAAKLGELKVPTKK